MSKFAYSKERYDETQAIATPTGDSYHYFSPGQFHDYINPTLKISNLQIKVDTATSCQKNV